MKIVFPTVFALFWTAIVGVFDIMIGYNLYNGLRAQSFATSNGTITHSEVAEHSDSDGKTYGVDIRYDYHVQGRKYSGSTYRYSAGFSSDSDWAHEAVGAHKVGARVPVYYDQDDPKESVLRPGIEAGDLFLLMFMTPFNLVMAGMWWYGGTMGWHWWSGTKSSSVNAFREHGVLRLRVPDAPPIMAGFIAFGLAAFASIFIVGFTSGFHPSMTFILIAWAAVIATGAGTGLWIWKKQSAGDYDVVIGDRTIDLPIAFGREHRDTIERKSISGVAIEKVTKDSSDGPSYSYAVNLQRRGAADARVAEWTDEESARELAKWLTERLGLPHRSF